MATVLARPVPQATTTFAAWRISETNSRCQPLDIGASALTDAVDAAKVYCAHKDVFVVREHDAIRLMTLAHFYTIKRESKGRWTNAGKVHDLYAEHLFTMAADTFEPSEPWRWTPGADVVGRIADVVESAS